MKKIFALLLLAVAAVCFTGCDTQPIASFTFEGTQLSFAWDAYYEVKFTNLSSDAKSYSWDFGDGEYSSEKNPTHYYYHSGTYTVTLKAFSKKGNSSEYSAEIVVSINGEEPINQNDPPTANFSITGSNQYAPAEVSFTNLSTNASSYSWDFGDGGSSSSSNPSHTYSTSGTYNVTLTAYNDAGHDVSSKVVNVKNNPTSWKLTKFVLSAYPPTEDDGTNWDFTDAGPDIYFEIKDANGTVLYTSSTKDNVTTSSLPLTWTLSNLTLNNIAATYTVAFYDEDGVLDPNDPMGSFTFRPNQMSFNSTSWSWTVGNGKWQGTWTYSWN